MDGTHMPYRLPLDIVYTPVSLVGCCTLCPGGVVLTEQHAVRQRPEEVL